MTFCPALTMLLFQDPSAVTVIKIGDTANMGGEVNLPYVLQDRSRPSISSVSTNKVLTRQSSTVQDGSVVATVAPEVSELSSSFAVGSEMAKSVPVTPEIRNVERPYLKSENDDRLETGSVITMTSDERVQIFVPSPQGTPYNTITKGSVTTSVVGAANLAPLFVPHRMPNSESYRSLTPLNMSANSPIHHPHDSTSPAAEVIHEASLEMVKISLISSTTSDKTMANDIESLPVDQPVSLSQIQLEEVENTD
jgi:hypothetical protein